MHSENYFRNRRGNISKKSLHFILYLAQELGYVTEITRNYKTGKDGYDAGQFKAPYRITFCDTNQ